MDDIRLLCNVSELSWVFTGSHTIEAFLDRLVTMVADHMQADVCSIYLLDADAGCLVLRATRGLSPDAVDRVALAPGEGLAGLAHETGRPVREDAAGSHPRFKHFTGINEERFDAFLALPIRRGLTKIGVLVLQRRRERPFSDKELEITRVVTNQLANIIENARLLTPAAAPRSDRAPVAPAAQPLKPLLRGTAAAEGVAGGHLAIYRHHGRLDRLRSRFAGRASTMDDFRRALDATRRQLEEIQRRVEEQLSDVASLIFTAHLLMLKDGSFISRIEALITAGSTVPDAIITASQAYIDRFRQQDNLYIREKADDIRDLAIRLCRNLLPAAEGAQNRDGTIVVADELLPSDILTMAQEGVAGFILVTGGATSHVAFLARSLRLPLLVVDEPRLLELPEGIPLQIDGEHGTLFIDPSPEVQASFAAHREHEAAHIAAADDAAAQGFPHHTSDGTRIELLANVNLLVDLPWAARYHADGVGLYRSEIPFLVRSTFPTEEEQYVIYRQLVEKLPGRPITIRTLDIGGDKVLSYYRNEQENNPFLGMRSIRFSLEHREIFRQQLRAILRAAHDADVRIMFPMISAVEEFRAARIELAECIRQLDGEGIPHRPDPPVGLMIEIPAVLPIIGELAREADFFSVGTNDLVQYLLAVDRTNEKVADLYRPHHPAVIRALKQIADASTAACIPVTICGDMATRQHYFPLLLGLGYRRFSLDTQYLPRARQWAAATPPAAAAELAAAALNTAEIGTIEKLLEEYGAAASAGIPHRTNHTDGVAARPSDTDRDMTRPERVP
ncbi:MAG: phosphoenolpyruvate--protein phosphotransferase [Deltaproteobacteria bacterium]|nr:phosphoenolpyruvate--protein phosphotransferase [Candidatus Anaeroferrophillacea bacterium]